MEFYNVTLKYLVMGRYNLECLSWLNVVVTHDGESRRGEGGQWQRPQILTFFLLPLTFPTFKSSYFDRLIDQCYSATGWKRSEDRQKRHGGNHKKWSRRMNVISHLLLHPIIPISICFCMQMLHTLTWTNGTRQVCIDGWRNSLKTFDRAGQV